MTRWERVVVEVAVDHRRPETFGEGDGFGHCIAHHHTTPADDDGELGLGEHVGRGIEAGLATRTAVEDHRRRDLDVDVTVEAIARDVELGRPDLRHRPVEAASGDLRHPVLVGDVPLILHELLEHGQLVGFLETTQALPHGAGLRGDHHDGAVGPERCCDRSDTVGDAGAVLADHHTVLAADPGIPVGHVGRALLVHHRHEFDTGWGEDVHGIHERAAHDAERGGHAVGDHRLDEGLRGSHAGHRDSPVRSRWRIPAIKRSTRPANETSRSCGWGWPSPDSRWAKPWNALRSA